MYKGIIYIPNNDKIMRLVFREMHDVLYAAQPRYQRTIMALRKQDVSPKVKKDAAEYLVKSLQCQKVKVEHKHSSSLLQPLPIMESK